jgi:hypothetical protein
MHHHLVTLAAANAVDEVIDGVASGSIPAASMLGGGLDDLLAASMDKFFKRYGPSIAENFSKIAEPAAAKAGQILGPVIEEKLRAYTPTFALITGAVVAGAILIGGWQARRELRGRSRRRRAA